MYTFANKPTHLSSLTDYDHYMVDIGNKKDYVEAMAEPTYFDYTSPITKTHVLQYPYLIP